MAKPTAAYRVRGPFAELTLARIRELTREPEALFWVFVSSAETPEYSYDPTQPESRAASSM